MSNVETQVERIAQEILKQNDENFELVDVEYVKEKDWYLRIFIDKEGGVGLDDCQKISEQISKLLDQEKIIDNAYYLEVSSPGLDRLLKKPKDFIRERGKSVDVTFYEPFNGKKILTGVLKSLEENFLTLENIEPIPMNKVASVRLHIDF